MIKKKIYLVILIFLLSQIATATDSLSVRGNELSVQINEKKIDALEAQLLSYKEALFNEVINSYQQTNDRINSYLTFVSIIATIFGLIIAIGGIFIGFESIKSRKRRQEAIKTLDEAKAYVENKKSDFDSAIDEKLEQIENEYQKILNLFKQRLLDDVNKETQRVKDIVEKKSQEIEGFSVEEKSDKVIESLQDRIQFFENIGIPDDPKILISKARLLSKKDMHNEAIELLKRLINIEPDNSNAYWLLGFEYSKLENNNESIENYKKCIEFDPNDAGAYNNLAVQMEKIEKFYDALKYYEKAIELNTSEKLFYKNKAKILIRLRSIDDAYETYKQMLDLDSKDINSYYIIIGFLKKQNRFEDTIEFYDLCINNIEDKKQEFMYLKALMLRKLKHYDDSITVFQGLIDFDYNSELCYIQIAEIKNEQGNKVEAIKIMNSAISINPKSSTLYLKKARFQINDSETEAIDTIIEGSSQIEGENYLQASGKLFLEFKYLKTGQKFYSEALSLMEKKLPEEKEGNLVEYYESLIITDKHSEAQKFLDQYDNDIISPKYIIVKKFLTLCASIVTDKITTITEHISEFVNYDNSDDNNLVKWIFDDILFYIKIKIDEEKYEVLHDTSELLKNNLSIEEYNEKGYNK